MTENKSNLAKAVLSVMEAVAGVEKNTNVGNGQSSYKGVSDKDVKQAFRKAFIDAKLVILPVKTAPTLHIESWEEVHQQYKTVKVKRSVLTEVETEYLLIHSESGESQVIVGYGHGVDSQDKSAGKATTYALKYALLYTFLTPTGDIDDSDNTHSEDIPLAQRTPPQQQKPQPPVKKNITNDMFQSALEGTANQIKTVLLKYNVTPEMVQELQAKLEEITKKPKETEAPKKEAPVKEEPKEKEETKPEETPKELPRLSKGTEAWDKVIKYVNDGTLTAITQVTSKFKVSKALAKTITDAVAEKQEKAQEQRLPAIPVKLYEEALKMEPLDVIVILEKYRMSASQRTVLEGLSK